LDINIGKSVYINGNMQFSRGLTIRDNAHITGNVVFGKNVTIHKNVEISTYPDQTLVIGDDTIIFQDNIIKGNTQIGKQCRIESGVNVTGSNKYPTIIGDRVMIKGTSYIFGSVIEENTWIEHCVLKTKKVHCHYNRDGEIAPIRYVIPPPEGLDDVESIGDDREEYTWPPEEDNG
ncbi:MAG: multidrug transporter, partial [candidate division Zixibacteria bacterium]|nr:multidrug transporter [Gammaproteobacteria bacterium]NIX55369.1 multidrug transporter [candidate division Zixibacteria bacterium]